MVNLYKHVEAIVDEKVVTLADFQEVKIYTNNETISHIKKLSKETGLTPSRVVEALIRAALDDLPVASGR